MVEEENIKAVRHLVIADLPLIKLGGYEQEPGADDFGLFGNPPLKIGALSQADRREGDVVEWCRFACLKIDKKGGLV